MCVTRPVAHTSNLKPAVSLCSVQCVVARACFVLILINSNHININSQLSSFRTNKLINQFIWNMNTSKAFYSGLNLKKRMIFKVDWEETYRRLGFLSRSHSGDGLLSDENYPKPRKFTVIPSPKTKYKLESVVDVKITNSRCTIIVRLSNQSKYLAVQHNRYWKFLRAAIALYEFLTLTPRFNKMNSHYKKLSGKYMNFEYVKVCSNGLPSLDVRINLSRRDPAFRFGSHRKINLNVQKCSFRSIPTQVSMSESRMKWIGQNMTLRSIGKLRE